MVPKAIMDALDAYYKAIVASHGDGMWIGPPGPPSIKKARSAVERSIIEALNQRKAST